MNDILDGELDNIKMNKTSYALGESDRAVLRSLAGRVAELAARPVEAEKRKLWYRHNELEATRPVIFCDPENGWNEIITDKDLKCENELARSWELHLRKEIFWGELMGDDRVIEPYFNISHVYNESDWGLEVKKHGGENGGSYVWDAPLKSYDNLDKLHFPKITVDYKETEQRVSLANEILGDLLEVRKKTAWWWTLGMTWTLVDLRGMTEMMMDMYDYPDELHRLMGILRDGHLAKLDFLEKNSLLSLNNDGTYVGSGGFGYTSELPSQGYDGHEIRTADMWGFCESQETTQISPDMFEEFIFPYQLPIMERFGLNCYGCCEPLDKRWHVVKKFPKLRRISVSPWANLKTMAELLEGNYIYSMKPNPADLALSKIDEEYIRKNIREALRTTRGCRVEVIMKDNHTIGKNPDNIIRWCKIVREEADSI